MNRNQYYFMLKNGVRDPRIGDSGKTRLRRIASHSLVRWPQFPHLKNENNHTFLAWLF